MSAESLRARLEATRGLVAEVLPGSSLAIGPSLADLIAHAPTDLRLALVAIEALQGFSEKMT